MKDKSTQTLTNTIQKRFVFSMMLLSLSTVILLLLLFLQENMSIKKENIDSYIEGDNKNIHYYVDRNGFNQDGSYSVEGWCIKPGVQYSFYNYGYGKSLKSVYNNMHIGVTDGKTVYIFPTKLESRDDVDKYMNDGIDYKFCGFKSKLPRNEIEILEVGRLVLIWQNPDGSKELYFL